MLYINFLRFFLQFRDSITKFWTLFIKTFLCCDSRLSRRLKNCTHSAVSLTPLSQATLLHWQKKRFVQYDTTESKIWTFDSNISAKSKPYSKILQHVNQGAQTGYFSDKTGRGVKLVTLSIERHYETGMSMCLQYSISFLYWFHCKGRVHYFKPVLPGF